MRRLARAQRRRGERMQDLAGAMLYGDPRLAPRRTEVIGRAGTAGPSLARRPRRARRCDPRSSRRCGARGPNVVAAAAGRVPGAYGEENGGRGRSRRATADDAALAIRLADSSRRGTRAANEIVSGIASSTPPHETSRRVSALVVGRAMRIFVSVSRRRCATTARSPRATMSRQRRETHGHRPHRQRKDGPEDARSRRRPGERPRRSVSCGWQRVRARRSTPTALRVAAAAVGKRHRQRTFGFLVSEKRAAGTEPQRARTA